MKKPISIVLLIALILILAGGAYVYGRGNFSSGIKRCPEAWYDNKMPSTSLSGKTSESRVTQYLIVDGERRSLKEFNTQWIRSHCAVNQPSVVW